MGFRMIVLGFRGFRVHGFRHFCISGFKGFRVQRF